MFSVGDEIQQDLEKLKPLENKSDRNCPERFVVEWPIIKIRMTLNVFILVSISLYFLQKQHNNKNKCFSNFNFKQIILIPTKLGYILFHFLNGCK